MIVIPMAGMSSRFSAAGYLKPKYMLPLHGRTVFSHAMNSFKQYFDQMPFLFIARDVESTKHFILAECLALGINDVHVHILGAPTAGQAETVEMGLLGCKIGTEHPITIFNIDTFRPDFRFPSDTWFEGSDGYLEVFHGAGPNWSYARALNYSLAYSEPIVAETAEKRPISDLCCTGLYHFAKCDDFHWALARERQKPSSKELYVAPVYNHLINNGSRIHYNLIASTEVIFCGVPDEYHALLTRN